MSLILYACLMRKCMMVFLSFGVFDSADECFMIQLLHLPLFDALRLVVLHRVMHVPRSGLGLSG